MANYGSYFIVMYAIIAFVGADDLSVIFQLLCTHLIRLVVVSVRMCIMIMIIKEETFFRARSFRSDRIWWLSPIGLFFFQVVISWDNRYMIYTAGNYRNSVHMVMLPILGDWGQSYILFHPIILGWLVNGGSIWDTIMGMLLFTLSGFSDSTFGFLWKLLSDLHNSHQPCGREGKAYNFSQN